MWRDDFAALHVVGDIEQRANVGLIGQDALREPLFATEPDGRTPDHKTAFGTDRHDHGIFDVLCFHQAQNLGTKIFAPVRPAQSAARDAPHPQVHPFHGRAKHPGFDLGSRQWQTGNAGGIQLEREGGACLAAAGVEITAPAGRDHGKQCTQNTILVCALKSIQRQRKPLPQATGLALARRFGQLRIMARCKKCMQVRRNPSLFRQRFSHVVQAEGESRLQQVATHGAQQVDLVGVKARTQNKAVERVAIKETVLHGTHRREQALGISVRCQLLGDDRIEFERLNPTCRQALGREHGPGSLSEQT